MELQANAALIVALVNSFPALADALEAQAAEIARLKSDLQKVRL